MSPEYWLVFSMIGLGLGVAYAWWIVARPILFQADLQAIRAQLDAAMQAEHNTDDPSYFLLRDLIGFFIDRATYLSVPVTLLSGYLRGASRFDQEVSLPDWIVEAGRRLIQGEGIHPAVKQARDELLVRVLSHLIFSPGNYLTALVLLAFGKTKGLKALLSALRPVLQTMRGPLPLPTHAA